MKGDVVLIIGARTRPLPLRAVQWMPDSFVLTPGYRRGQFRKGQKPPNHGRRFPADPPLPEEVMRMLDCCTPDPAGVRNRALLATMWRAGLRVSEALAIGPHHVDFANGQIVVLAGKGSKRGVAGIDPWGLDQIRPWLEIRARLPIPPGAPLFCGLLGGALGNPLASTYIRQVCKRLAVEAGVPRRFAPHQLRHAHACDMAREGIPVHLISRQLRHSNLGVTATYLQGIAPFEVVNAIGLRPAPVAVAA